MQREIKFRGYFESITGENYWVYGYLIKQFKAKFYEITNGESTWTVKHESQFTGLYDKNGTEIYEGDLVKHDAWDYPFKVIFHKHKARFVCELKSGLTQYIDYERIVVVGNVYDTPTPA